MKAPVVNVLYDVRNPPASTVIATFPYSGPPLVPCLAPVLTFSDASSGSSLSFLSSSFDAITSEITISLTDSASAVKGTYNVNAVFSNPGTFTFPLGLTLEVYDICDSSTFPSAPVLSTS
jgi:hypothetical protein